MVGIEGSAVGGSYEPITEWAGEFHVLVQDLGFEPSPRRSKIFCATATPILYEELSRVSRSFWYSSYTLVSRQRCYRLELSYHR